LKIAILSDLHGNIEAFEQVLFKAHNEGISKFLFLGDFVGYYYWPEKVLDLLSTLDFISIQGNHERILQGLINGEIDKQTIINLYGSGHEYALSKLNNEQIDFLINLPVSLSVEIDGCQFQLCHGSPIDTDEYIYPDNSIDSLNKCNVPQVDFVLIGHSHYQFIHRNTDSLLVNVGSVGQSRSTGGLAQWAMVNTRSKSVQLMSTPYDASELIKQSTQIDFKIPYLREVLTRQ
jgi:putative phosphoesterase